MTLCLHKYLPVKKNHLILTLQHRYEIAYGNSSAVGNTCKSALSPKAPWPISRRPGEDIRPTSPTENGGKLYWCMNLFSVSVVKSSINCASLNGPNVVTDNTCVSPRVNNAEPCTRGSKSICESSGRSSSNPRPSGRIFSSEIKRRTSPASTSTPYSCACLTAFSLPYHLPILT